MPMRWQMVAAGLVASVAWLTCRAGTVVPDSSAATMQWTAGNARAFLAGGAFGAAVCLRHAA